MRKPKLVKFPKRPPTLAVGPLTFRLINDFDKYANGSMLMRLADTEVTGTADGVPVAAGAALGAILFVQVGRRTYTCPALDLIGALTAAEDVKTGWWKKHRARQEQKTKVAR